VRAGSPEATLPRPRTLCKNLESRCVATPSPSVEVGRGRPDSDEADVHVHRSIDADDVAQPKPVLINAVGRGLSEQSHPRANRKQLLGGPRRGTSVALRTKEDLRRVDLDETNTLPVAKRDRVTVDYVVDAKYR
jgi:hypothetical protein